MPKPTTPLTQSRTSLVAIAAAISLIGAASAFAQAEAESVQPTTSAPKKEKPTVYDESADAKVDIANAVAKAKKNNSRVLIQWGANWCGWCIMLDNMYKGDSSISRKLMYEYEIVHVDIGRWNKNVDLTEKYGADLKNNGVPYLTVLDGNGDVVTNHETGSLESEDRSKDRKFGHDPEKVLAFLTEHQATYESADILRTKALALAETEDKRVFLHFGAPWCGWCHRLEDWMERPRVKEILAKEFVDLKIDTDRTIGGQDMLDKMRNGQPGGIPWFAFLDQYGEVQMTSDGPDGNVGFPVQENEIAHFINMLKDNSLTLSDEDLQTLQNELKAAMAKPKSPGSSH